MWLTYSWSRYYILTAPVTPGEIDRKISNFSSTNLRLKWEPSGQNTFLNHYRVEIEGHQQQTFGNVSQIYWTKKLSPGAVYNVSIIAVSYGDEAGGPWSGYLVESEPYRDWIEIDKGTFFHILEIENKIIYLNKKCLRYVTSQLFKNVRIYY